MRLHFYKHNSANENTITNSLKNRNSKLKSQQYAYVAHTEICICSKRCVRNFNIPSLFSLDLPSYHDGLHLRYLTILCTFLGLFHFYLCHPANLLSSFLIFLLFFNIVIEQVRTALSMEVSRCDLLVQVVGARNVPLRVEVSCFHLSNSSCNPSTV